MSQPYLHRLTGAKRSWLPDPDPDDAELTAKRQRNDERHHSVWSSIIDRYSKDFTGIGDEVDLRTNEIIVDNGHIARIEDEFDNGNGSSPARTRCFLRGAGVPADDWEEYTSDDDGSNEGGEDSYGDEGEEGEEGDEGDEGDQEDEGDNVGDGDDGYDDDDGHGEVDELNSDWPAQTPQRMNQSSPVPRSKAYSSTEGPAEQVNAPSQQSAPELPKEPKAEVAASVEAHEKPEEQTHVPQPQQQFPVAIPDQLQAAMQAMTTVMSSTIQAQMMAFMNMMMANQNLATAPIMPAVNAAAMQNIIQAQALIPAMCNPVSESQDHMQKRGQQSMRKSALTRSRRSGASRGPGRGVTPGAPSLWAPSDSDSRYSRRAQGARGKPRHSRQRDSIPTDTPEPRSGNLVRPHKSAQQPRIASNTHVSRDSLRVSSSPMAPVPQNKRSPQHARRLRTPSQVVEDSEDDYVEEIQATSGRKIQPMVVVPAYYPLQGRRDEPEIMAEEPTAQGKRQALPDTATAVLERHYALAGGHPCSTALKAIAEEARLTLLQTTNWFARTRRRNGAGLGLMSKARNKQMSSTDEDTNEDDHDEAPVRRDSGRLRVRDSKVKYNARDVFMGMFDDDSDADWQPPPRSARIKRPRPEMTKDPIMPEPESRPTANGVHESAQKSPTTLGSSRTAGSGSASIQQQPQRQSYYNYDWALPTRTVSPSNPSSHKDTPTLGANAREECSAKSTPTSQSPLRHISSGLTTKESGESSTPRSRPNVLSGRGAPFDDINRRCIETPQSIGHAHSSNQAGERSTQPGFQASAITSRTSEGPATLQSISLQARDKDKTGQAEPALIAESPGGKSCTPHLCPNCKATSSIRWVPNPIGGRLRFCNACSIYYRRTKRLRDPKQHGVRRASYIERGACDHCAEQMYRKVKPDGHGKRYCQTCRKYAKKFGGRLPMDFIRKPKPKCQRCKMEVPYIHTLSNDIDVCEACHDDIFRNEHTLDGRNASESPAPQSSGDEEGQGSPDVVPTLSHRPHATEASKAEPCLSDLAVERSERQSQALPRTSIRELVTSAEQASSVHSTSE